MSSSTQTRRIVGRCFICRKIVQISLEKSVIMSPQILSPVGGCHHIDKVEISFKPATIFSWMSFDPFIIPSENGRCYERRVVLKYYDGEIPIFFLKWFAAGCILLTLLVPTLLRMVTHIPSLDELTKCSYNSDLFFSEFSSTCLTEEELLHEFLTISRLSNDPTFDVTLVERNREQLFDLKLWSGQTQNEMCPRDYWLKKQTLSCIPSNGYSSPIPINEPFLIEVSKRAQLKYKSLKETRN